MYKRVAVIGAGVSGLTCGVLFAELGNAVTLFAEETGERTTSAAAGAIWFPYDAEPFDAVIHWALRTLDRLRELATDERSGVAMTELRCFARVGELPIPDWADLLGARRLSSGDLIGGFTSGYAFIVPVIDTGVYLDYLAARFSASSGFTVPQVRFHALDDGKLLGFDVVVNCSGVGARELANDTDVEPHRGQVAIVAKPELPYAVVCDDPPLMYIIPRGHDCVFGGTNEISANRRPSLTDTRKIVTECSRVLDTPAPEILAEKVGLRPYRRTGIRLELGQLSDGRPLIHNYGHGGCGFTLSWGCAESVLALVTMS